MKDSMLIIIIELYQYNNYSVFISMVPSVFHPPPKAPFSIENTRAT